MNRIAQILSAAVLIVCGIVPAEAMEPRAFLDKYCFECHGPDKQKGERRYDQLTLPAKNLEEVLEFQDIVDQLNLGEMPPKKSKQPSTEERLEAVNQLTQLVAAGRTQFNAPSGQTVLRRLNIREYRKTVGDLFALDMRLFDPTVKFPRDSLAGNMDNQGEALKTSGYLLAAYLEAADEVVERALAFTERPKEQTWGFNGHFIPQKEHAAAHTKLFNNKYICIYEGPNASPNEGGYTWISDFAKGVPSTGTYEIKVKAQALNRINPNDPKLFGRVVEEPFRLAVVLGNEEVGPLYHPQILEPKLAEVTVKDGEPEWYTLNIPLGAGQTPRFIFPNGPQSARVAIATIGKRIFAKNGGVGKPSPMAMHMAGMGDQSFYPHIRIHEVQIRGPIFPAWPSATVRSVLGDRPFAPERTREILTGFANRAYRRPVQTDEVDRLMQVVEARKKAGRSPFEALKDGLKAVLCSPSFLYLANPGAESLASPAHVLASRMSYFLGSSMPDDELRRLADNGELLKPEVRIAQTRRILGSRGGVFVEGFLNSWLNLRSLGQMPPDRGAFKQYYNEDLQAAMKVETQLFTWDLLSHNKSIINFLDSKYTFINQPLANLYGLGKIAPPELAHEFRPVGLTDPRRGGLLGMGSVLTVSANGVETSPVTRGVWILENIFGTPPPPPPDNVAPIDPDVRGSKNIRDLLVKHRENATCFQCHQRIDPPGFALESFDPIGAWRTHYSDGKKEGPKIDPSGELSGGQSFQNIVEFKKLLLSRKDQFAHMLTERLLSYACGRRITGSDRPEVDKIIASAAQSGLGLRSLVESIVLSDTFTGGQSSNSR